MGGLQKESKTSAVMDSLEQISGVSDVSSGVIDLSTADTDSTSGNKTKDISLGNNILQIMYPIKLKLVTVSNL